MPGSYSLDELPVRRSEHIEAPVSGVASHAWVVDPSTLDAEQPKKIAGADQVRVILLDELDVQPVAGIRGASITQTFRVPSRYIQLCFPSLPRNLSRTRSHRTSAWQIRSVLCNRLKVPSREAP